MRKRILILGSTGKMGLALEKELAGKYEVTGKSSRDFDANDLIQVRSLVLENKPDILINTVAFLGIDPCEKETEKALRLNTLLPKLLAGLSNELGFLLVHFSTDAVFSDKPKGFCLESDMPAPLNIYGFTKFGGDCFIRAIAKKFYIFRVSVLFGESQKNNQFVEKMLSKIMAGDRTISISSDIISSPTYSADVAQEVKRIIEGGYDFGLYHLANKGKASLFELMYEIIKVLGLKVSVRPASFKDFPYCGIKNTRTPLKSVKLRPLRPWKSAVKDYCAQVKHKYTKG